MRLWGLLLLLAVGCGNQTVCATDEALAFEPRMHEILTKAVAYWDDRGRYGVTVVEGNDCDVPVTVSADIPGAAQAMVGELIFDTTVCWSDGVSIHPDRWTNLAGFEVRVMAHEVGHLLCLDDIEIGDGVMSTKNHIQHLDDYQLDPEPVTLDEN